MTTQLSPPSPHYPAFHLSSISSSFSPYWLSPSISCLAELLSHQQPFLVWCPSLLFSSSNKKLDLNSFQLPPLTKRGCCSDTGGRGGRQLFIWDEQELYGTEVAAADKCEQLWWHYCRRLEHHHKRGDTFQSDRGSSSRFVSQVWTNWRCGFLFPHQQELASNHQRSFLCTDWWFATSGCTESWTQRRVNSWPSIHRPSSAVICNPYA